MRSSMLLHCWDWVAQAVEAESPRKHGVTLRLRHTSTVAACANTIDIYFLFFTIPLSLAGTHIYRSKQNRHRIFAHQLASSITA